jgi:hypothetical protein
VIEVRSYWAFLLRTVFPSRQANIASKGKNSYYHAHAPNKEWSESMAWDGKEEPRMLAKAGPAKQEHAKKPIAKYAFSDEDAKVKLYIDLPGVGALAADDVTLDWTQDSFSLVVRNLDGATHGLTVNPLYDDITKAAVKRKPDRVIVTLYKKNGKQSWFQLKRDNS